MAANNPANNPLFQARTPTAQDAQDLTGMDAAALALNQRQYERTNFMPRDCKFHSNDWKTYFDANHNQPITDSFTNEQIAAALDKDHYGSITDESWAGFAICILHKYEVPAGETRKKATDLLPWAFGDPTLTYGWALTMFMMHTVLLTYYTLHQSFVGKGTGTYMQCLPAKFQSSWIYHHIGHCIISLLLGPTFNKWDLRDAQIQEHDLWPIIKSALEFVVEHLEFFANEKDGVNLEFMTIVDKCKRASTFDKQAKLRWNCVFDSATLIRNYENVEYLQESFKGMPWQYAVCASAGINGFQSTWRWSEDFLRVIPPCQSRVNVENLIKRLRFWDKLCRGTLGSPQANRASTSWALVDDDDVDAANPRKRRRRAATAP